MLTRLARTTILASVAAILIGAALGYPQLAIVGLGLLLGVGCSCAWLLVTPTFEVTHQVERTRVTVGDDPIEARVTVTNTGRRSTLPVVAVEHVGERPVELAIERLTRGASTTRSFEVGTERRGLIPIGPLEISEADPFGFTSADRRLGVPATLRVHPRSHPLVGLPASLEGSVDGPPSDTAPRGSQVFHALREYVPGDDLRLIHWKTTARTGKPTIRQHVDNGRPDLTVVVDTRATRLDPASFEHAIEAAASLCVASANRGFPVRLCTTDGQPDDREASDDAGHLLDRLAGLTLADAGRLVIPSPGRSLGGPAPALALVTGRPAEEDLQTVVRLRPRYGSIVIVDMRPDQIRTPHHRGIEHLQAATAEEFARTWNHRARR